MNRDESDRLWALVRRLQRAPEALDDVEARRALTVLTASRADATYLLLQRVLVLETALDQIRQQRVGEGGAPAVAAPTRAGRADPAGSTWRPSVFLRDAAVIATGVVGGGLVLDSLGGTEDAAAESLVDVTVGGLGDVGGLL